MHAHESTHYGSYGTSESFTGSPKSTSSNKVRFGTAVTCLLTVSVFFRNSQFSPRAALDQSAKPYHLGSPNTNQCPAGQQRVTCDACGAAATQQGNYYYGSHSWANHPAGCFRYQTVYYAGHFCNTHPSGRSHPRSSPVCETLAASSNIDYSAGTFGSQTANYETLAASPDAPANLNEAYAFTPYTTAGGKNFYVEVDSVNKASYALESSSWQHKFNLEKQSDGSYGIYTKAGPSTELSSGSMVHWKGFGTSSIRRYFHSNYGEGAGMSWGSRDLNLAWRFHWDGALRSGMEVHIFGVSQNKYLHSNSPEHGGMSWGSKHNSYNWYMEWDGELKSGTVVYLKSKYFNKYFHSNYGENQGFSWGGKSSMYAWTIDWDQICSGTTVEWKGSGSQSIGKYFHSNYGEGRGMSWGSHSSQYSFDSNWRFEWTGTVESGMEVDIYGVYQKKYLHSNSPEYRGMSWGSKHNSYNWYMEWDGELKSGTVVYLKSKHFNKYFHSNYGENQGFSWGGKSSNYAWQLEWNEADLNCQGAVTPVGERFYLSIGSGQVSSTQHISDWRQRLHMDRVSANKYSIYSQNGNQKYFLSLCPKSETPTRQWFTVDGSEATYMLASEQCRKNAMRLATFDEICPHGGIWGGTKSGDQWAPYGGQGVNEYVQVGTSHHHHPCKKHTDYNKPWWGTDRAKGSYETWILCVKDLLPTTTLTGSQRSYPGYCEQFSIPEVKEVGQAIGVTSSASKQRSIESALSSGLLGQLAVVQPNTIADLNKREGALYDVTAKIADMCTVSDQDVASGVAATKNQICSFVPVIVIGNYMLSEVKASANIEDMEDTGCADLPLHSTTKYFLFGISLPAIEPIFEGGNLCFAQALTAGNTPLWGTGALLFKPALFVGNPVVKNLNVPVPGTGQAITKASALVEYVAMGISIPDQKLEMEFNNDWWRCSGSSCSKTMTGHFYAGIKLDLTNILGEKLKKRNSRLKLGDLTISFEAKVMINFDPSNNGISVPLLADVGKTTNIMELADPENMLDFVGEVVKNDFAMGINGKLMVTVPLGDWSHGLFRDLDITIGSSQAKIERTGNAVNVFASLYFGGVANGGIMADIKSKILDKFQDNSIKAITGFIGAGLEKAMDLVTGTGVTLDTYISASCTGSLVSPDCSSSTFGIKISTTTFEAYIENNGGFKFCFAIKGIFDSCGDGLENILALLSNAGKLILSVGKALAAGIEAGAKEVAKLGEAALEGGKVVVEEIGQGFEQAAGHVAAFAAEALNSAGDAAEDALEWSAGAAATVVDNLDEGAKAGLQFAEDAGEGALHVAGQGAKFVGDTANDGAKFLGNVASGGGQGAATVANEVKDSEYMPWNWGRRRLQVLRLLQSLDNSSRVRFILVNGTIVPIVVS